MREIRHTMAVLVTLLTVAGMTVASLALARSNGWPFEANYSDAQNLQVCIDKLYRTTHCQLIAIPLRDHHPRWYRPLYSTAPNQRLFFALKINRCHSTKRRKRSTLFRVLFPPIPDLRINLDRFAIHVKVSSNLSDFEFSTIHLGYRNCW